MRSGGHARRGVGRGGPARRGVGRDGRVRRRMRRGGHARRGVGRHGRARRGVGRNRQESLLPKCVLSGKEKAGKSRLADVGEVGGLKEIG